MRLAWFQRWHSRPAELALWVIGSCFLANAIRVALDGKQRDFDTVWNAANAVLGGRTPYALVTHGGDYVHTPGSTLIGVPLGLLSEGTGGKVMVLAGALAFVVGMLLAAKGSASPTGVTAIGFLAFAMSAPLAHELGLANVDALCLLPLGLGMYYLGRRRHVVGGALIGLALTIKPTMVLLAFVPLVLGSASGTVIAVAVAGVLNLIAVPILPEGSRFFTSVVPFLLEGDTDGYNISLKAALERTGMPSAIVVVVRLGALAALLGLYARYRDQFREQLAAAVAFLVISTVFVTSYFFDVHLIYLALAIGVAAVLARPAEWAAFGLAVYLLLSPDVLRSSHATVDAALGFRYVVGAAFLVAALCLALERARRASRVSPAVALNGDGVNEGALPAGTPTGSDRLQPAR